VGPTERRDGRRAQTGPRRYLLGAFGDPGHAFPTIALGRELARRGHEVTVETWSRWRVPVEAAGMRLAAAPEHRVFPPLAPYDAVVRAAASTARLIDALAPDAVVADVLTLAPALAAERAGVPWATLVPHVWPVGERGMPPYSIGARAPRTALGRALWAQTDRLVARGLARGRDELDDARRRLGLEPLRRFHGGQSERLVLVATLPELETPRSWPAHVHVVGPMPFELPSPAVAPPPGDDPLVVVAPSTSQDPAQRLLRAVLEGLARERVRVLAATGRPLDPALDVPANARVAPWLPYATAMRACDLVVGHGGHGTLVRALACGAPVLAVPAGGDMNENAARLDRAGLGVRLPRRLASPRAIRLAVRRALADERMRARVRALHVPDGPARGADLLEAL
jgi:UDP:flavonoid glycosyltransferase YjiC (YdhE family)